MASNVLERTSMVLVPITDAEKKSLEERPFGDERICVLYELPYCEGIHIGMMSESIRRYLPGKANVGRLDYAESKSYFYDGGSDFFDKADYFRDRPVFLVKPTDFRTVGSSNVINAENRYYLRVKLEDVVRGEYELPNHNKPKQFKKNRY